MDTTTAKKIIKNIKKMDIRRQSIHLLVKIIGVPEFLVYVNQAIVGEIRRSKKKAINYSSLSVDEDSSSLF